MVVVMVLSPIAVGLILYCGPVIDLSRRRWWWVCLLTSAPSSSDLVPSSLFCCCGWIPAFRMGLWFLGVWDFDIVRFWKRTAVWGVGSIGNVSEGCWCSVWEWLGLFAAVREFAGYCVAILWWKVTVLDWWNVGFVSEMKVMACCWVMFCATTDLMNVVVWYRSCGWIEIDCLLIAMFGLNQFLCINVSDEFWM